MQQMSIKAFIFDMGGTLEDVCHKPEENRAIGTALLKYLADQGVALDIDPEEFLLEIEAKSREYRAWGMESLRELTPYEIWSQWYLKEYDIDDTLLRVIANNIANIWERNYYARMLRPESPALLKALHERGYRLGVISNTGCQTQVIEILHEYGLHQYFSAFCLSSLSGYRKPHAQLFLATAADLGVLPSECVYVGDTISRDVRGARASGYGASVRIQSHLTVASDSPYVKIDEEADYLVKDLLEILDLFPAKAEA